jgi:hypothetical protein
MLLPCVLIPLLVSFFPNIRLQRIYLFTDNLLLAFYPQILLYVAINFTLPHRRGSVEQQCFPGENAAESEGPGINK